MPILHPSTRFKRSFKKQPAHIQDDLAAKAVIFQKQPFHALLHTHKLSGGLGEYYAFYL
ncbi:MAG: hypothetical protein Q8L47_04970 [bacterium]|nr:hypothetical protein [bacterium]